MSARAASPLEDGRHNPRVVRSSGDRELLNRYDCGVSSFWRRLMTSQLVDLVVEEKSDSSR